MKKIKVLLLVLMFYILNTIFGCIGIGNTGLVLAEPNKKDSIEIIGVGNVETYGDVKLIRERDIHITGTTGLGKMLTGVSLDLKDMPSDMLLVYRAHVQTYGNIPKREGANTWKDPITGELWLKAPAYLGIIDEIKGIEGIEMRLINQGTDKDYEGYEIQYQLHVQMIGWMEQVSNGEFAGTKGKAMRAEAIAMRIADENDKNDFPMMPVSPKYLELYIKDIEGLIKGSPVFATIKRNTKLYSSINGKVIGQVSEGSQAQIIQDKSYIWYQIASNGKSGWVKGSDLSIPKDPPTNMERLTREQLETYVNYKKISSFTSYFIWVDIDRQLTYIFKNIDGRWQLDRTMICATGKNKSPTVRGTFKITDRGPWFYSQRLKSGAKNWIRFYNSYLFHSIAFDSNGNVQDATLGKRASAGCIRLSMEDIEYIYDTIPRDTTVWIN